MLFCHRWHNRMEFKQFAAWNPPVMSSRTPCVEPLHDASGPTSRIVVTQIMMPDEIVVWSERGFIKRQNSEVQH